MQEHRRLLGFALEALTIECVRYDVPVATEFGVKPNILSADFKTKQLTATIREYLETPEGFTVILGVRDEGTFSDCSDKPTWEEAVLDVATKLRAAWGGSLDDDSRIELIDVVAGKQLTADGADLNMVIVGNPPELITEAEMFMREVTDV